MSESVSGAVRSGRKTVTTPGTEVQLATATDCDWIDIQALTTNTGKIAFGDATISLTAGSEIGPSLTAGQSASIPVSNASKIYIDAEVANEGVTYNIYS